MSMAFVVGLATAGAMLAMPALAESAHWQLQPITVTARIASAFADTQEQPFQVTREYSSTGPIEAPKTDQARQCPEIDSAAVSNLVRAVAAEEGVDADLADAVAWVESRHGAARQQSSAGAMGIMQLMPGTAEELGVVDRCAAEANVRAGIRYMKQLYAEFGDPLLMLAAYNAGPAKVRRSHGIPEIPETAGYIVKVLNRWKLAALGPQDAATTMSKLNEQRADDNAWKDGHVIEVE